MEQKLPWFYDTGLFPKNGFIFQIKIVFSFLGEWSSRMIMKKLATTSYGTIALFDAASN